MIVDLTAAWSGPYTAGAADILQPLGGAVMVSFGAAVPDGIGDPVIVGRLALAPGQVFFARATDAAVTAQFYVGPQTQGAVAPLAPPVNTGAPTITGTPQDGQTLFAGNGTWTNSPTGFAYQWLRNGVAISGATSATFTLTGAQVGAVITVRVTASNALGAGTPAVSAATAVVTAAAVGVPVNTVAPAISGTAQEGQTLSASTGTWTNIPTGYAYVWRADGTPISGATASTITLTGTQVGAVITVQVTASNAAGAGTPAVSAATAVVTAASGAPAFEFAIFDQTGSSTIASVPNLRVSLNAGSTWQTLSAAGLTIARSADGAGFDVTGFGSEAARDAALFHFEQQVPGEPNAAASNTTAGLPALYARRVGGPAPINTTVPGWPISATRVSSPVGVTA